MTFSIEVSRNLPVRQARFSESLRLLDDGLLLRHFDESAPTCSVPVSRTARGISAPGSLQIASRTEPHRNEPRLILGNRPENHAYQLSVPVFRVNVRLSDAHNLLSGSNETPKKHLLEDNIPSETVKPCNQQHIGVPLLQPEENFG